MLHRVLEPEVMDTEEDAREYDAIDNAEVNAAFVDEAAALAPDSGDLLDVGCGPGQIAVLLARRLPAMRIVAADLAEEMLRIARRHVSLSLLGKRIDVVRADAKATGFPAESFDMVVSNSLAHHIPEPLHLFQEIRRVSRRGAAIFVKDLLRPAGLDEWRHLVQTYAADCNAYQRRLFADSLRAALSLDEVAQLCHEAGLTGVIVERVSDRHWAVHRTAKDQPCR